MSLKSNPRTTLWAVGIALAAGCEAQATPDYPGEALSEVRGSVVNQLTQADPPEAVVIANWGAVGAMFPPDGTQAEVEGEFPARFSLALYEPPPEDVLFNPAETISVSEIGHPWNPADETRIAVARILAVGKDAAGEPNPFQVLGASEQHVLVYVEGEMAPGGYAEALFHGRLTPGYHLVEVRELAQSAIDAVLSCEVEASDAEAWKACGLNSRLHAAPSDASVTVRLADESELAIPEYGPIYLSPGDELDPPAPVCVEGDLMNPCP